MESRVVRVDVEHVGELRAEEQAAAGVGLRLAGQAALAELQRRVLRVGDVVIDASLRSRAEQLRAHIQHAEMRGGA